VTDDDFELTIDLTRGSDTNNRDKMKCKVTAPTIEILEERVDTVRERMEDWATDLRHIQPDEQRRMPEDQQELGEVGD
jgi:hypothetical protein